MLRTTAINTRNATTTRQLVDSFANASTVMKAMDTLVPLFSLDLVEVCIIPYLPPVPPKKLPLSMRLQTAAASVLKIATPMVVAWTKARVKTTSANVCPDSKAMVLPIASQPINAILDPLRPTNATTMLHVYLTKRRWLMCASAEMDFMAMGSLVEKEVRVISL